MNDNELKEKRIFHTLDGLRGIAALVVLADHVPDPSILHVFPGATLAVDLFFALSGFVLSHSYTNRLRSSMGVPTFMTLRLVRLYPLYIFGTLAVALHGIAYGWLHILGSLIFALLFLPTPPVISPDLHPFPLNFPAWSLFYELVINFVFALVIRRLSRGLLIVALLFGILLLVPMVFHFHGMTAGSQFHNFWGGGCRVVYSFFSGIAIYRIWAANKLSLVYLPTPICMACLALIFACEPLRKPELYDLLVVIIALPLLVLAASRAEPGRLLQCLCSLLGRTSYAIYVIQIPIIIWTSALLHRATGHMLADLGVRGTILVATQAILYAILLDKYFDPWARNSLKRLFYHEPISRLVGAPQEIA